MLDTGLPQDGTHSAPNDGPWVDSLIHLAAAHGSRSGGLTGIAAVLGENDSPDTDGNHRVDPVAGHGMFIASILARLAPTASVTVLRVIQHLGQATEDAVAEALGSAVGQFDLVNLSFSTYTPYEADVLARAIRAVQRGAAVTEPAGDRPAVVVASAGNDGIWAPSLPASLPDVISVAALDEHERGPAWFTNYGPWVSACAPGTDIEGAFWQFVDGERAWQGRATWSGTSFAAPYVVGALARAMHFHKQHNNGEQISAMEAVARVIDDPDRPWMPWLGTVVRGF